MPNSKCHRKGHEDKDQKRRLSKKASSFHGQTLATLSPQLHRPKTAPDLLSGKSSAQSTPDGRPRLTKLLLNVTIQRSLGIVQVVMMPESTVGDLVAAALRQYVKEGRRPILSSTEASDFELHYSQFSLESLDHEEKLMALGSRNFFLCPKRSDVDDGIPAAAATCSKQAEKASKISVPWLKFMDFLF